MKQVNLYVFLIFFFVAKAQKEKENLKKAELEAAHARQSELAKVKETALPKPKPLLPTPTAQPKAVPTAATITTTQFMTKPKDVIEKPPLTASSTLPSSTGSSLFGSSALKLLFGSPQVTTTAAPAKTFDTKSMFGSSEQPKSQLSFGPSAEKPAQKPEQTSNLATSVSFGTAAPTSTGLTFSAKPIDSTLSGNTSSNFSFGPAISVAPPAFGSMSQIKSEISTPSASIASQPKPALLQTPTSTNKEPVLLRNAPIVATGANISPKQMTKTPLLATPPNIQPQQINIQASTTATTASPFKVSVGNAFAANTTTDKTKSDKENNPVTGTIVSLPNSNTSSIGKFSFLSGLSNTSTTPTKPNVTPSTANVSAPSLAVSVSTPTSTVTASTPSSVGFSFAKASAQTAVTTTTTSTATTAANVITSSSDASSVFQGFNICKPNVADNSSGKRTSYTESVRLDE